MLHLLTENIRRTVALIILLSLTVVSIILAIILWQQHTKSVSLQHKFANLEKKIFKHQDLLVKQSAVINLQSQLDKLQQNFTNMYNKVESADSLTIAHPESDLKSALLLTKLTAMQLFLNKDADISKNLLSQAINKLTKINDPRLNIVLYNLQDQYTNLGSENKIIYKNQEVIDKIQHITNLVNNLMTEQSQPNLANNAADTTNNHEVTTKLLDLIKVSHIKPEAIQSAAAPTAKLSPQQLEMIKLYLEQTKLSYLQSNDLLFTQTIASIKNILTSSKISSDTMLNIQNELDWLANIKIIDHKLILQAILQLEDYVK
jgi:uncharacterized coiled-coil protein SlyX